MTCLPLIPPTQIQFELFEHTNVYRKPLVGDYYQSVDGIVIKCNISVEMDENVQRWILHPKDGSNCDGQGVPPSQTSQAILNAQDDIDNLLEDSRIFLRRRIGEILFNLRQELND